MFLHVLAATEPKPCAGLAGSRGECGDPSSTRRGFGYLGHGFQAGSMTTPPRTGDRRPIASGFRKGDMFSQTRWIVQEAAGLVAAPWTSRCHNLDRHAHRPDPLIETATRCPRAIGPSAKEFRPFRKPTEGERRRVGRVLVTPSEGS